MYYVVKSEEKLITNENPLISQRKGIGQAIFQFQKLKEEWSAKLVVYEVY